MDSTHNKQIKLHTKVMFLENIEKEPGYGQDQATSDYT